MLRFLLFPFSFLYGMVVYLRNRFFDWGWFKSTSPETKTIVVGNLALGGTGKSPHIEYLIRLLNKNKTGVLSRGYKRKTKGFVLADSTTTAVDLGDEPKQFSEKFPNTLVAVCEDRLEGIKKLSKENLDVILLDDAFQHRKVKGGLNILLTTYEKPFFSDHYIPTGTLRDHKLEYKRADMIIVSKCPETISEEQKKKYIKKIQPLSHQAIFFSSIKYGNPGSLPQDSKNIILLTGIANTNSIIEYLKGRYQIINHLKKPDHYHYTIEDLNNIRKILSKFASEDPVIITTEKDFVKIKPLLVDEFSDLPIYFLPIEIDLGEYTNAFEQIIKKFLAE